MTGFTAKDVPDQTDKTVFITGANTGLGFEAAKVLAGKNARVLIGCRSMDKAKQAKKSLLAEHPGADIDIVQIDLGNLASVEQAAATVAEEDRLDLLINNAGIMIPMERRTEDGFEAHLGINHLGHFLFTQLLLPSLLAARSARVVALSSAAMGMATLTPALTDLNWEARRFSGFRSYGDSKLMNLMFARELNRRYSDQGLVANALHPGVIATELARDQSFFFMALGVFAIPFMKSVPCGAATSVYVATSADYERRGGLYFSHCAEKKPDHKLALNDDACAQLWDTSLSLVGL